jgi:hypothetical protein
MATMAEKTSYEFSPVEAKEVLPKHHAEWQRFTTFATRGVVVVVVVLLLLLLFVA